jgi:hypothetical protein
MEAVMQWLFDTLVLFNMDKTGNPSEPDFFAAPLLLCRVISMTGFD